MRSTALDLQRPSAGESTAVAHAVADVAAGRMVVVVGDAGRRGEADLVLAAEHVTADAINFMVRRARGLVFLALTPERCAALGLRLMAPGREPALTVTVEAREGVTTGISTADQAHTIRTAARPGAAADDIAVPGHVRPVRARAGGLLEHRGPAEAAIDLVRLAGLPPAAVLCGIQAADGSMARGPVIEAYCAQHGLTRVSTGALVAHRLRSVGGGR